MRDSTQRAFIAIDEWLGIAVAIYLRSEQRPLFWPFVVLWALAVYGVSYPTLWYRQARSARLAARPAEPRAEDPLPDGRPAERPMDEGARPREAGAAEANEPVVAHGRHRTTPRVSARCRRKTRPPRRGR